MEEALHRKHYQLSWKHVHIHILKTWSFISYNFLNNKNPKVNRILMIFSTWLMQPTEKQNIMRSLTSRKTYFLTCVLHSRYIRVFNANLINSFMKIVQIIKMRKQNQKILLKVHQMGIFQLVKCKVALHPIIMETQVTV